MIFCVPWRKPGVATLVLRRSPTDSHFLTPRLTSSFLLTLTGQSGQIWVIGFLGETGTVRGELRVVGDSNNDSWEGLALGVFPAEKTIRLPGHTGRRRTDWALGREKGTNGSSLGVERAAVGTWLRGGLRTTLLTLTSLMPVIVLRISEFDITTTAI